MIQFIEINTALRCVISCDDRRKKKEEKSHPFFIFRYVVRFADLEYSRRTEQKLNIKMANQYEGLCNLEAVKGSGAFFNSLQVLQRDLSVLCLNVHLGFDESENSSPQNGASILVNYLSKIADSIFFNIYIQI